MLISNISLDVQTISSTRRVGRCFETFHPVWNIPTCFRTSRWTFVYGNRRLAADHPLLYHLAPLRRLLLQHMASCSFFLLSWPSHLALQPMLWLNKL